MLIFILKSKGESELINIQHKEMAKKARNEYHREYRKKNKDKIKEINVKYWANKYLKNEVKSNDT